MKTARTFLKAMLIIAALCAVVVIPRQASAHAVLLASTPAANATVKGPSVAIHLKFNSRLDGKRSRLYLVDASGKVQTLTIAAQDAPDTLDAGEVKVTPGAYTIRWQALAADGHITRGEIPFTVQ